MAAYFCDASGIVKRYIQETGTAWMQALANPAAGHRLYLARITTVEVISAVTRRQRGGSLSAAEAASILAQFRQDLPTDYGIVEITPVLLSHAMTLAETHGLRAYDAVQLAAVIELQASRTAGGLRADHLGFRRSGTQRRRGRVGPARRKPQSPSLIVSLRRMPTLPPRAIRLFQPLPQVQDHVPHALPALGPRQALLQRLRPLGFDDTPVADLHFHKLPCLIPLHRWVQPNKGT
jgi:predicted nucleic acid-binding protein